VVLLYPYLVENLKTGGSRPARRLPFCPSQQKGSKKWLFMFRRKRRVVFPSTQEATPDGPLSTEGLQASGEQSSHSLKTVAIVPCNCRRSCNKGFKRNIPAVFSIAPSAAAVYDPFEQFIARWGLSFSGATKTRPIELFPTTTIADSVVNPRDRNQKCFFCFVFIAIQRK